MELIFVALIGAGLGIIARYCVPNRHSHGALVIPAVGVCVACLLWVALTWLGLAWNGGWIWWITVIGAVLSVFGTAVALGTIRTRHDENLMSELSRTGVTTR